MIYKDHEEPLIIKQLEALDYLLLKEDPQLRELIQYDLAKEKKGFWGEKAVDFPLSFLPEKDFLILHNLRIPDKQGHFQMDTLILSVSFFLILEIKNWEGVFEIDQNGQATRIDLEKEDGYGNPIAQVKLQRFRLMNWMRSHKVENIPIHYYVVFSSQKTVIKTPLTPEFTYAQSLKFKLDEVITTHSSPLLKRAKILQIAKKLVKSHTPKKENVLKNYNLTRDDLKKGVICPNCMFSPMLRIHGNWLCSKCGHKNKDGHIQAFNYYFLLIDEEINNKAARELLQIDSPYIVKKLLQKEGYPMVGKTSSRKYKLFLK